MKKVNHTDWLRKQGLLPSQIKARKTISVSWRKEYSDSLKVDRSTSMYDRKELSVAPCVDKSVMANLHKEKEEVQKQILAKAARTAPLYNKGGYQYISDGTDLTDIGKKK